MTNNNNLKEFLLPRSLGPKDDDHQKEVVKKRKYHRVRSAPLIDRIIPVGTNDIGPGRCAQTSQSLFRSLHQSFKKVAALLTIYLSVGAICFYAVRHHIRGETTNPVVDALYFCVVTMTTVGYGDLVPRSSLAKLLACAFVFSGMAFVGLILSKGADYLLEKQEALVVRALNLRKRLGPSDIMKEIETNKTGYKCFLALALLLMLITIGTIFLALVEELDFVDAFYCVCVTITTLGYGDKSFSTEEGRIFAVFWILTSTICLGQFFFYVAELNTEQRQKALVKCVLTRPVTNMDLEAADIDEDGTVDAAEFVLYKLKEMGKIRQEDVLVLMKEFEELDVDQSGTLSLSDITLAQSSAQATKHTSER